MSGWLRVSAMYKCRVEVVCRAATRLRLLHWPAGECFAALLQLGGCRARVSRLEPAGWPGEERAYVKYVCTQAAVCLFGFTAGSSIAKLEPATAKLALSTPWRNKEELRSAEVGRTAYSAFHRPTRYVVIPPGTCQATTPMNTLH